MDFTPDQKSHGHTSDNITRNDNGEIVGTRELTTMQRIFIDTFVASGGDRVIAATKAGYSQPNAAASQLLNNPRVRQALFDARELELDNLASLGLSVAREILQDKQAPFGVRASLATRFIDMRHDPKIKALQGLSEKRIDEMNEEELQEHAEKLDKALADMGLMIDATPDKAGNATQSELQTIEQHKETSV